VHEGDGIDGEVDEEEEKEEEIPVQNEERSNKPSD
jgi:hypothetical protein